MDITERREGDTKREARHVNAGEFAGHRWPRRCDS